MNRPRNRRLDNHRLWLLLGLLATFSLSLFLIPAFVIRPLRHQSERALDLAIAVKRIAPPLTLAALVGVLALSVRLWRRSSRVPRTGIVIALVISVASAVMVRQNHLEWVFHPIPADGVISRCDAPPGGNE